MRSLSHRIAFSGLIEVGFLISVTAALAAPPAATLKIPDSTPVKLFLTEKLDSATNEIDDPVHFEVVADVKVSGVLVIAKGSAAGGHVVDAQHRKRVGHGGKIEFTLDYVKAVEGTNIRLRMDSVLSHQGKGVAKFSPLVLLPRGKNVDIPQGTHLVAYVDGDQEISLSRNGSSPGSPNPSSILMQTGATQTVAAPSSAHDAQPGALEPGSEISSIVVTSIPAHAEITVDGKFLGTTPSTVRLAPGDHSVLIEKSGYKAWQRIMTVNAGGTITLDVTLEKIP